MQISDELMKQQGRCAGIKLIESPETNLLIHLRPIGVLARRVTVMTAKFALNRKSTYRPKSSDTSLYVLDRVRDDDFVGEYVPLHN